MGASAGPNARRLTKQGMKSAQSSKALMQVNRFRSRTGADGQQPSRSLHVRVGSKADLTAPKSDFRFTTQSGLRTDIAPCPFRADSVEKVFFD